MSELGFIAAMHDVRDAMIARLGLRELPIADELAHADAELHGQPITCRVEHLGGAVRARFATVVGAGIEVASVLAIAPPSFALPIFGADLVAIGPTRALVVLDLSPTSAAHDDLGALVERLRLRPELPRAGALPQWCEGLMSPHHVFARIELVHAAAARGIFRDFARSFAELRADASPRPTSADDAAVATRRWLAAHRTDDKSFGVLAHAFGAAWTRRAIDEALFPVGWS
ncbi:MAG TPA: hypothetical protein VG755_42110 [Nannocystaceae bacterium]|nr:hypothetical protein [Nannocystaceae bacterium]